MTKENYKVDVIIPTMASRERAPLLKRAIESIRGSSIFPVSIIVIVNGERYDSEICEWLSVQSDIHVEYLKTPSMPEAVLRGRELVTSEYFSTLDDDDEYLEGSTDEKMLVMASDSEIDLVVSSGYRHVNSVDKFLHLSPPEVSSHPLRLLMDLNWLCSCNALYRTASIELKYFRDGQPYAEWTWLAFRLAMTNKKIGTMNKPAFRYYDTADSLSKSKSYAMAYFSLFERMLDGAPPASIARLIRRKIGATWHDAADAAMKNGNRLDALKYHWRSLMEPDGIRYLSYSRYFFS